MQHSISGTSWLSMLGNEVANKKAESETRVPKAQTMLAALCGSYLPPISYPKLKQRQLQNTKETRTHYFATGIAVGAAVRQLALH